VEDGSPNWGIEPVPERLRVLGLLDTGLLWANLSVSLLVIVAGALLVPALSLSDALLVILVGAVLGNAWLGLAGLIGADARVPAMVLMRAPLGRRGSYAPTAVNVLQGLGWATFELIIIATAAAALSDELFGFEAKWLWTIAFGGVAALLAFLGPVGVVRRYLRKFAVWVVIASIAYLAWWTLDRAALGTLWDAEGEGGFPTFWHGTDLVIASIISWTPLAADYTRFTRTRRDAFWGTGVGYLVPTLIMFGLGALLVLALPGAGLDDPTRIPAAVAAGGIASLLALFALTVDEADEAFANVYSTAVSLQNVLPAASQRALIAAVAATSTVLALVVDLGDYLTFLYLLGSVFVPLFGVLVADWVVRGRRYTRESFFAGPAFRPEMLAAWLAGFALYQWLAPNGPAWWVDFMQNLSPATADLNASVPSFLASFALAALLAVAVRRRG
jgi:putative hydroxymethylpyrimidine transporter CytX